MQPHKPTSSVLWLNPERSNSINTSKCIRMEHGPMGHGALWRCVRIALSLWLCLSTLCLSTVSLSLALSVSMALSLVFSLYVTLYDTLSLWFSVWFSLYGTLCGTLSMALSIALYGTFSPKVGNTNDPHLPRVCGNLDCTLAYSGSFENHLHQGTPWRS